MIIFAIIAAAATFAVAYIATGRRIARKRLPRMWAKARENWTADLSIRMSVREQAFGTIVFWPLAFIFGAISARMDRLVDSGDPVTLQRKLDERERHIADLERELGIGRRQ